MTTTLSAPAKRNVVPPEGTRGVLLAILVLALVLGGAALIGWLLDGWLGTRPWVMLALLFLGFGIAVRNVLWIAKQRPE